MTEVLENEMVMEAAERPFLVRTFATEMTAGDGRTIDLRVVPFGKTATVADGMGGVPRGVPYQEEWMPGVFDGQLKAANRVLLNFEHQMGIAGIVGHGVALQRGPDGYTASFRVHDSADGDKALHMVKEGVLGGASLEAYPQKSVRKGSVVQRVKAHLDKVALCRTPAFDGAVVLAVRIDPILDEEFLPIPFNPEIAERMERLGLKVPERLKAQPAPSTPSDDGTDEPAPAETNQTTISEVTEK